MAPKPKLFNFKDKKRLELKQERKREKSVQNCQKVAKMAKSRKNITTAAPQINHSIKNFPVQNEIKIVLQHSVHTQFPTHTLLIHN